jgi:hypothetical protein
MDLTPKDIKILRKKILHTVRHMLTPATHNPATLFAHLGQTLSDYSSDSMWEPRGLQCVHACKVVVTSTDLKGSIRECAGESAHLVKKAHAQHLQYACGQLVEALTGEGPAIDPQNVVDWLAQTYALQEEIALSVWNHLMANVLILLQWDDLTLQACLEGTLKHLCSVCFTTPCECPLEGSKLAKSETPKNVKRYVEEHLEQGMDVGKAWAIAWSRYCKYKRPGSPRCKQEGYLNTKKGRSDLHPVAQRYLHLLGVYDV